MDTNTMVQKQKTSYKFLIQILKHLLRKRLANNELGADPLTLMKEGMERLAVRQAAKHLVEIINQFS